MKLLYPDIHIVGIDSRQDRMAKIKEQFKIEVQLDFFKAILKIKPLAAFICTPPLSHDRFVCYALEQKVHTFSEINLTDKAYDVS